MSQVVQIAGYAEYRNAVLQTVGGELLIQALEELEDLTTKLYFMPAGTCTDSEINHIEIVGQGDVDIAETFIGDGRVVMNIRKQTVYRYNGLLYTTPFK